MYGRFKRSPWIPEWFVVFSRRPVRRATPWAVHPFLRRAEFSHVIAVGYHPTALIWTVLQASGGDLRVAPLQAIDLHMSGIPCRWDWPGLAADDDKTVLLYRPDIRRRKGAWPAQFAPLTCASLVHYALALGGFPAVTPDRLYRRLLAAGATPVTGKE